jgi:uncharacterized RmlC-like cupin family protein
MAQTKYGHLLKGLPFQDYGLSPCRQGALLTSELLGIDVNVTIERYGTAGKMGKEPFEAEIHDYDEVMVWLGMDTNELSELGAEVELCLGEEKERHMLASASAVLIPKGVPHFPATITRMDKPFLFMKFSLTKEMKSTPVMSGKKPGELVGWQSKYRKLISHLTFARKAAWHYGPANPDDSGGSIAVFVGNEFPFTLMCESIKKAPYRFGPLPEQPHTHPYNEFGITLGADMNDLNVLDAEIETGMGAEMERHVITKPVLTILPKDVPHGPLAVTRLGKPFITVIVKPYTGGIL